MIEVTACLPRGPVFLAGETIHCDIIFTNISRDNDLEVDTVAWSSVQIICQCTVSESRVQLPKTQLMSTEEASSTGCETSFVPNKVSYRKSCTKGDLSCEREQSSMWSYGWNSYKDCETSWVKICGERGLTVMCTKPKILFCDLKLQPGESKSYKFEDTIPTEAPPTFRGQAVKYSYKVIIGTQRPGATTKLLRIPFRVMVMPGMNDISVYNETEEIRPSNPFLHNQRKDNSVLDIALQVMATVTARKAPHSYNITNTKGKVAKFLLFKQAFKLGEDIVGMFDFSEGTIPCVQFSVTLQSEEQISEECRRKPGQGSAVTSYVKHQEMCLHTVRTHINLPIPLTATPAFMTDIVCQRWRLHFEFVTSISQLSSPADAAAESSEGGQWRGPATLDVETMVWDLPIKVFPTNPLHASSVTLLKTGSTIHV